MTAPRLDPAAAVEVMVKRYLLPGFKRPMVVLSLSELMYTSCIRLPGIATHRKAVARVHNTDRHAHMHAYVCICICMHAPMHTW